MEAQTLTLLLLLALLAVARPGQSADPHHHHQEADGGLVHAPASSGLTVADLEGMVELLRQAKGQASGGGGTGHSHAHTHNGHSHAHGGAHSHHHHGHSHAHGTSTATRTVSLAALLSQVQGGSDQHSAAHHHDEGHDAAAATVGSGHGAEADLHSHGHDHGHEHAEHAEHDHAQVLGDAQLSAVVQQLLACARDADCSIAAPHEHEHHDHDHGDAAAGAAGGAWGLLGVLRPGPGGSVLPSTKVAAAALLFVETVVGLAVPFVLAQTASRAWTLSLLNAFAGGIFLSAGLLHLVPHCQEAQGLVDITKWHLPDHFQLYLLLICLGYLLVFCVERVVFEGHDHGHGHSHGSDSEEEDRGYNDTVTLLQPPYGTSAGATVPRDLADDAMFSNSVVSELGVRKRRPGTPSRLDRSRSGSPGGSGRMQCSYGPCVSPNGAAGGCGHMQNFSVLRGIPLLVGMGVHTALECLALGLITRHSSFLVLFTAIATHKGVSAMALAAKYTKEGASKAQVLTLVGPFTLVAPTSIAAGHLAGQSLPASLQLLLGCLATGTFLYVGASEILAEEFEGDVRCGRRDISKAAARVIKFGAVMVAVVMIAALGLMPHVHE